MGNNVIRLLCNAFLERSNLNLHPDLASGIGLKYSEASLHLHLLHHNAVFCLQFPMTRGLQYFLRVAQLDIATNGLSVCYNTVYALFLLPKRAHIN